MVFDQDFEEKLSVNEEEQIVGILTLTAIEGETPTAEKRWFNLGEKHQ